VKVFFQDRVSQTICPGWLRTTILLISASCVAKITGVSHQRLAIFGEFFCCNSYLTCDVTMFIIISEEKKEKTTTTTKPLCKKQKKKKKNPVTFWAYVLTCFISSLFI
jgi:hypothetical protein